VAWWAPGSVPLIHRCPSRGGFGWLPGLSQAGWASLGRGRRGDSEVTLAAVHVQGASSPDAELHFSCFLAPGSLQPGNLGSNTCSKNNSAYIGRIILKSSDCTAKPLVQNIPISLGIKIILDET